MEKVNKQADNNTDMNQEILRELRLLRKLMEKRVVVESVRKRFLVSMLMGFGTVLGATILVSASLFILQQFTNVDILAPIVERIIEIVQKTK